MTQRLFVYGAMAPGRPHAHVLATVPGTWELAAVRGKLLPQGRSDANGGTAIVIDEGGPEVHGMLFTSDVLAEHWERLDRIKGDGLERVLTSVKRQSGATAPAYVYAARV